MVMCDAEIKLIKRLRQVIAERRDVARWPYKESSIRMRFDFIVHSNGEGAIIFDGRDVLEELGAIAPDRNVELDNQARNR